MESFPLPRVAASPLPAVIAGVEAGFAAEELREVAGIGVAHVQGDKRSPSSRPNGWCSQHLPVSFPNIDDRSRDSQTQARHESVSLKETSASRFVVPREKVIAADGFLFFNVCRANSVAGVVAEKTAPEVITKKEFLRGQKGALFIEAGNA